MVTIGSHPHDGTGGHRIGSVGGCTCVAVPPPDTTIVDHKFRLTPQDVLTALQTPAAANEANVHHPLHPMGCAPPPGFNMRAAYSIETTEPMHGGPK